MFRNALMSEARWRLIRKRQGLSGWGPDYQPSMRATREEAPRISRPSTLYSSKVGRELHLMSRPERDACVLALYHPRVFDIHEQHVLSPVAAPHPLAGRTEAQSVSLFPLKGTVDVAARLNMSQSHPAIWITESPSSGRASNRYRVPFPYVGDLLLFLYDGKEPYCVNWTVKNDAAGFSEPGGSRPVNPYCREQATKRAELRHRLEETYFADAGIRTVRVAAADLNRHVMSNLTMLIGWSDRKVSVSHEAGMAMTELFRECILEKISPLSRFQRMQAQFECTREDCLAVLYQGIWCRNLRVDLHSPVLVDRPLRPEQSDVLIDYVQFFAR